MRPCLILLGILALTVASPLLAQSSKDRDRVESLFKKAEDFRKQGKFPEAAKEYESALKLAPAAYGPDAPETAVIFNNLGRVYQNLGEIDDAERCFQRSLDIRDKKDLKDLPLSLASLAELYRLTGRYDRAEPLYRQGLKVARAKHGADSVEVARAQNNLALFLEVTGQYDQAEPLYRSSLAIFQKRLEASHPDISACTANLGRLYQTLGQYDRAKIYLKNSLELREKRKDPNPVDVAQSLNHLGDLARILDQDAEAEQSYKKAYQLVVKSLGKDNLEVARALNNLAGLYESQEDYAKAQALVKQSLEIREAKLGKDHPGVGLGLNNLAWLLQSMGQDDEAEAAYSRCMKIFKDSLGANHPYVAQVFYNLTLLHAARGEWNDAINAMDQARHLVRRHAARVLPSLSEPEQLSFLQTQHRLSLDVALSLGVERKGDARAPGRSADWALNGKGIAQQALAERSLLARDSNDPRLGEAVQQLLDVRTRLATLLLQGSTADQATAHKQQVSRLTALEESLAKKIGRAAGAGREEPWVSLSEVRKAIPADSVLIEMAKFRRRDFTARGTAKAWQDSRYAAWVIPAAGRGDIQVVDLGPADAIEAEVEAVQQAFKDAPRTIPKLQEKAAEEEARKTMQPLAKRVFDPLVKATGKTTNWILSPDASLWLIPWIALPLDDGYAIETYQIRYVVSGRDLVNAAETGKTTRPLVMANPDYDLARGRKGGDGASPSRTLPAILPLPKAGRLPGTEEEANAVVPKLQAYTKEKPQLVKDREATEELFKSVRRPRVLSLATHGYFLEDVPTRADERGRARSVLDNPLLRCGLLLAGANNRDRAGPGEEDGILTGLEIVGSDLRGTEMVVLSACETSTGKVNSGEGVVGLRQEFQLAGARTVVGTLWQVPDAETVQLMTGFFTNLADGKDKANALRDAQLSQLQSRRNGKNRAAHPFFWAAFTLTGN